MPHGAGSVRKTVAGASRGNPDDSFRRPGSDYRIGGQAGVPTRGGREPPSRQAGDGQRNQTETNEGQQPLRTLPDGFGSGRYFRGGRVFLRLRCVLASGPEDRDVAARRQEDLHGVACPGCFVVFGEPLSQAVRLNPDDGVLLLVEVGATAEGLDGDVVFLDRIGASLDLPLAHITKEQDKVRSAMQHVGPEDAVQRIPFQRGRIGRRVCRLDGGSTHGRQL